MTEIPFDKYDHKGAYHWTECLGPIHRRNAYTMGRYQLVLDALAAHGVGYKDKVLDVGCGDGALSWFIAKRTWASIYGVDTSARSIELAANEFRKRGMPGAFDAVDGYEYPHCNRKFQAVVCADVIEHVYKPDKMLREMWRLLAPGGVLIITTPIRYTEYPDRLHVQEWFPNQFKNMCESVLGLPVVQRLSHPVALAELYASSSPVVGRASRLAINLLAKIGLNPFMRKSGFRAFSTQTVIAVKPDTALSRPPRSAP